MLLFVLTREIPAILFLGLLILCYLTAWDLWSEKDLPFLIKAWWVLLVFLLNVAPVLVPYVGWALGLVLMPFGWLLVTAAYIKEVRENPEETADLLQWGFPVEPRPVPGPAARQAGQDDAPGTIDAPGTRG